MSKKVIALSVTGGALALLLAGYFFVVPTIQVGMYKSSAVAKHSELNEVLNKLTAVLETDTFVKSEVTPDKIRSDVKAGNEAAKQVEEKLAQVKSELTTFDAWPLLGFNEKYKTALSLKSDEQQYVDKSQEFVTEMKAVLAYMNKNADLTEEVTAFTATFEEAAESGSPAELVAKIDEAIKKFEAVTSEMAKLTPPASLKESHDYSIKALNEYVALFKELSAALKSENVAKLNELGTKIAAKNEEMTKKMDDYNAQFIRESHLRKLDDTLNELDRAISAKQLSL